ncbi:hypothetical protein D3C75_1061350 [compost metagenome]
MIQCVIYRCQHQILEHLHILRINGLRLNGNGNKLLVPIHYNVNYPAAGGAFNGFGGQLFLGLHHLLLHFLHLLHHLVHVIHIIRSFTLGIIMFSLP